MKNRNMTANWQSDRILRRENKSEAATPLMDFAFSILPDAKRGDIKKWLKYGHFAINGHVATAFDTRWIGRDGGA